MEIEIIGDATVKRFEAEEVCHHPDDGRSLPIGDAVEDLIDGVGMVHRN